MGPNLLSFVKHPENMTQPFKLCHLIKAPQQNPKVLTKWSTNCFLGFVAGNNLGLGAEAAAALRKILVVGGGGAEVGG